MRPRIALIAALLLAVVVGVAAYSRRTHPPQTRTVTFEASATPSPTKQVFTCAGVTKKGERCKRHVKKQGDYCWQHKSQQRITEDDPRWDCKTMGNKICGPK